MSIWRKVDQTWCSWPPRPIGLIEMIGGSYLATTPNITYKRFLESLRKQNLAIHAWTYLPGLDHQAQANEAWKAFRECRLKLESRIGGGSLKPIRIGHSLGCKLHLISPDGGRRSKRFIGISFNNFKADKSIPILGKIKKKLKFQTEFSPSPIETINIIKNKYVQSENLLIRFSDDQLDQSNLLLDQLRMRENDNSSIIELKGNHLTPVSYNIKEILLDATNERNTYNENNFANLIDNILRHKN